MDNGIIMDNYGLLLWLHHLLLYIMDNQYIPGSPGYPAFVASQQQFLQLRAEGRGKALLLHAALQLRRGP